MESLRDVKRAMEREVKKGSCPLMFDRLEFGSKPFQTITSEEKLDEVLAYLLRVKTFRQYAEKTIINNVYMDLDMLCRNIQFKRTHSVIDREGIYARAQRYKKKLQPDYDRGLCLETVRCIFTLPEGEATLPMLELHYRKLDLFFSFAKTFECPLDEDRLYDSRERVADEINEILLHRLRNNIRFCARCGKALPLHHRGRLCGACFRRDRSKRF